MQQIPTIKNTDEERLKALNDERVKMVQRHEKPVIIHAISAAYLRERKRLGLDARA